MWMKFTNESGELVIVDMAKVVQINNHSRGSQLVFSVVTPDREGRMTARTLIVKEFAVQIARLLKAKAA